MTEQMTPDEVLALIRDPEITDEQVESVCAAVAALIAERDSAMDICRKLAALRDGLDNSNSSAEEMAAQLAHKAEAFVANKEESHG